MSQGTEAVKIYSQRRFPWSRIILANMLGILFETGLIVGAIAGLHDPDVGLGYLNDDLVTFINWFLLLVFVPLLILSQTLETLMAVGRLPVVILFERRGIPRVANIAGFYGPFSRARLTLNRPATLRVHFTKTGGRGRQVIEVSTDVDHMRTDSYGTVSDEDLAVLQEWVDRSAKT